MGSFRALAMPFTVKPKDPWHTVGTEEIPTNKTDRYHSDENVMPKTTLWALTKYYGQSSTRVVALPYSPGMK